MDTKCLLINLNYTFLGAWSSISAGTDCQDLCRELTEACSLAPGENPAPASLCACSCASCFVRCRVTFVSAASSFWQVGNGTTASPTIQFRSDWVWGAGWVSVLLQVLIPLLVGCRSAGRSHWARAVDRAEDCTAAWLVQVHVTCSSWWIFFFN